MPRRHHPALVALLLLAAQPAWPQALPEGDWRAGVLSAVNQLRRAEGLEELQPAPELQSIAQAHSDDMAAQRRLSHDGFQARFDRSGSLLCVENVAAGTTRAATLVGAWSRAPAHRRNLYEPRVRRAAIAVSGAYVTFFACE